MTEVPADCPSLRWACGTWAFPLVLPGAGLGELPSGDDAWTGFLLGGVLLALFPLPDLTAEAAPGSHDPSEWSGITLACTVSTREEVDTAFAAAVAIDSSGRRHRPVLGRALRIHRRPRGQPLGDHLVNTGHLRPARRPAVLGLSQTAVRWSTHGSRLACLSRL